MMPYNAVNDYYCLSIITLLCFCWPIGLAALSSSRSVSCFPSCVCVYSTYVCVCHRDYWPGRESRERESGKRVGREREVNYMWVPITQWLAMFIIITCTMVNVNYSQISPIPTFQDWQPATVVTWENCLHKHKCHCFHGNKLQMQ